jgi:predicted alpha/beta hydrolase
MPVVISNYLSQARSVAPVFVCLPAMGVAARFYAPFAEALARSTMGTTVLADLRGQGVSAALASRGAQFGYREIVEHDVPALITEVAAQFPERPIYLLGHSLGGQLGSLAAVHAASRLAGLILVASGTAHYRVWPRVFRWRAYVAVQGIRLAAAMLPWYPGQLLGFGGDQPRRLMADWSHNATTGRYKCAGSRINYEAVLNDVALPVLSVEIRDDPVAPAGAVDELLSKLESCAIERCRLDGDLANTPWRRHFSWARQPDEVVAVVGRWVKAQMDRWRSGAAAIPHEIRADSHRAET